MTFKISLTNISEILNESEFTHDEYIAYISQRYTKDIVEQNINILSEQEFTENLNLLKIKDFTFSCDFDKLSTHPLYILSKFISSQVEIRKLIFSGIPSSQIIFV